MRPVKKAISLKRYKEYQDAQQDLIQKLGEYCSYCERWIASAIHVEHKLPKEEYPTHKNSWGNFLLSCPNCNSAKGHGQITLDDYLWPDKDDTFSAFVYDGEGRVYPNPNVTDTGMIQKIKNAWKLSGLNKHFDISFPEMEKPTNKDNRWLHRREEWQKADRAKRNLDLNNTLEAKANIIDLAKARGMFSIWMTVFKDNSEVRKLIIEAFPSTNTEVFL